jgi:hypothetical protein
MSDRDHGPPGLWLTVSDLARLLGVSKQAVSKRVNRLEALGAIKTWPGERGMKLVNVAEFDKASGRTGDAVRQRNGRAALRPVNPNDLVLSEQQARRAAYDADLKKLELDERLGKVLAIDDVETAVTLIAEALVRKIDQLPSFADEVASAVARDGAQGARGILRKVALTLRTLLADEMCKLSQSTLAEPEATASEAEGEESDRPFGGASGQ